ncbi:MAG: MarR family transcriptional regulator [Acidocella sp.]|nr:MarR family transcriptional regulator [Acidocella sp.]
MSGSILFSDALLHLRKTQNDDLSVRALSVLLECAKGTQTVRGLAEALGINKPSITRAADRLQAEGWLRRDPDKADKRSVLLNLTPKGKTFARRLA